MASFTTILKQKRSRRHKRAGRARKAVQSAASTLSYDALFAACGEPGKKAPAPADAKPAS